MDIMFIDVKSDGQSVRQALAQVELAIDECKQTNCKILKILHGYGSHGRGGEIKRYLLRMLNMFKSFKKITEFIPAEQFCDSNPAKTVAVNACKSLIIDTDLIYLNSGITIVVI